MRHSTAAPQTMAFHNRIHHVVLDAFQRTSLLLHNTVGTSARRMEQDECHVVDELQSRTFFPAGI